MFVSFSRIALVWKGAYRYERLYVGLLSLSHTLSVVCIYRGKRGGKIFEKHYFEGYRVLVFFTAFS